MKFARNRLAVVLVTTLAFLSVAGAPAMAKSNDDVRVEGSCSKRAEYKVKASAEDGRIEIEAEVDSSRAGQSWSWKLWHNGSLSAWGTRQTQGPSGSFEVRRVMVDLGGTDWGTFRAKNLRSGEICRGVVGY